MVKLLIPALVMLLNGGFDSVRFLHFAKYKPGEQKACPYTLPQVADSVGSVYPFHPRGRGVFLCFLNGKPLTVVSSTDYGQTWGQPVVVTNSLPMTVTSALTQSDGRITIYFHSKDEPAIFSSDSYDGGRTWSFPVVEFRHNTIDLERAVVVRSARGKDIAVMHDRNSNAVLYATRVNGDAWSYPELLHGDFPGTVFSMSVRRSHVYVLFCDEENICMWRGHVASFGTKPGNYTGAILMSRTKGPRIKMPVFLRTGRDFGFVFD